jgi:hypothetical protein
VDEGDELCNPPSPPPPCRVILPLLVWLLTLEGIFSMQWITFDVSPHHSASRIVLIALFGFLSIRQSLKGSLLERERVEIHSLRLSQIIQNASS